MKALRKLFNDNKIAYKLLPCNQYWNIKFGHSQKRFKLLDMLDSHGLDIPIFVRNKAVKNE